jgi:hypothetical protein
MDETAALSSIKNAFQPSLIVWRANYTIGRVIHHLLV